MGVLSPAGAARERSNTCTVCGDKTWAHDRICGFCRPDAHEAAELRDEAMTARYDR